MLLTLCAVGLIVSVADTVLSQGMDTAWVRRYNGPGNGHDMARALKVDSAGNVHVTGQSYSGPEDYGTLKYNKEGDLLWVRWYNGPGNSADVAFALQIDTAGNVYITGHSYGDGTERDYATLKYDSDGNLIWEERYNGPGNGFDGAGYIQLDSAGSVYVTGSSWGGWIFDGGTGFDYATLKYDTDGYLLWVRRYNSPGDTLDPDTWDDHAMGLQVDGVGNVYVTGMSYGDSITGADYATLKYSPSGALLWVQRYNGPANSYDVAKAIQLDAAGNVYVTGRSNTEAGGDYTTLKYSPAGNLIWVRRYPGLVTCYAEPYALQVDAVGNVYVTGGSFGAGTGQDYATLKYDSVGNLNWERRYNGPGNSDDIAYALQIDTGGNVYVTGFSYGDGTEEDYATLKYDPDGNLMWELRYDGPVNLYDFALDLQLDVVGNVYVTGGSFGVGTSQDYATIKYAQYVCGDVDSSGAVNVADLTYLVDYLFFEGPPPPVLEAANVDGEGGVNVADLTYLVDYLFFEGPEPICGPIE